MGAPTGLIFNNLSWPHVSVATLVPADPINIPDFAIRLPHAPSFFGARVRASARVQPVVLAVEDLGEAARNLEQSIPRRLGQFAVGRDLAAIAIRRICEQRAVGTRRGWCRAGRPMDGSCVRYPLWITISAALFEIVVGAARDGVPRNRSLELMTPAAFLARWGLFATGRSVVFLPIWQKKKRRTTVSGFSPFAKYNLYLANICYGHDCGRCSRFDSSRGHGHRPAGCKEKFRSECECRVNGILCALSRRVTALAGRDRKPKSAASSRLESQPRNLFNRR